MGRVCACVCVCWGGHTYTTCLPLLPALPCCLACPTLLPRLPHPAASPAPPCCLPCPAPPLSGYEEAAAQGVLAGINAARRVQGTEPLVLGRETSYMGTLMDDLVTKDLREPYRVLTSRSGGLRV